MSVFALIKLVKKVTCQFCAAKSNHILQNRREEKTFDPTKIGDRSALDYKQNIKNPAQFKALISNIANVFSVNFYPITSLVTSLQKWLTKSGKGPPVGLWALNWNRRL